LSTVESGDVGVAVSLIDWVSWV